MNISHSVNLTAVASVFWRSRSHYLIWLQLGKLQLSFETVCQKRIANFSQYAFCWQTILLLANDPEQIVEIADAVLEGLMAGPPLPLFATPIDDAKWWVSVANLDERKAHLFACFHSLPDHLQHDFQSYTCEYLSK